MIEQKRKLGPDGRFISLEPQPEEKVVELDVRGRFNRRVAAAQPKPQEEPEEPKEQQQEEPRARAEPEGEEKWAVHPLAVPVVLVRKAPADNATAFARDMLTLRKGFENAYGTHFYRGRWWQWNGAFYETTMGDQRIWDMVSKYLNGAKVSCADGDLARFRPEGKHVNELLKFLRTKVGVDERDQPPMWMDGRPSPDPSELLAFGNCVVNVRTGETLGHDPRLWVHDGLEFDYPDKPQCPRWEWFLEDIHPGDDEAQMSIEEWLGYGMTWDNRFEKIAVWVGEPRTGRGTIASIQELLVGPNHHIPLNIHTWNNNENSKAGMIGKKVGIFHDVRLREPRQFGNAAFDPGGLDIKSIEDLLKYSSGDRQQLKEMYKAAIVERPKIKFTILTNKILNFRDEALLTRLFLLYFGQSKLGKEDKELKLTVLPSEISGIAWRCLAAYRRLRNRDQLLEPKSGLWLANELNENQNHWRKFMNRYWQVASCSGVGVRVKVFLEVYHYWAAEEGRIDQINANEAAIRKGVNAIREWKYLDSFRQFKPGAVSEQMANTVKVKVLDKNTGRINRVPAFELLEAVGK
jgi:putative DNA primase/helicase